MKLKGPGPFHSSKTPSLLPAVYISPSGNLSSLISYSQSLMTPIPSPQPPGDLSSPSATSLQHIPEGDTMPTKNSLPFRPQEGTPLLRRDPPETPLPKKGPLRAETQDPQERGTPGPSTPSPSAPQAGIRSISLKQPPHPVPSHLPPSAPPEEPRLLPPTRNSQSPLPAPVRITGKENPSAHAPEAAAGPLTGDLKVERDEGGEVGRSQPCQEQLPRPPRRLPHGGPGGTDTSPRSRLP